MRLAKLRQSRWGSVDFIEVALPPAVADLPAIYPRSMSFNTTFMIDKMGSQLLLDEVSNLAIEFLDPILSNFSKGSVMVASVISCN
jgi:hypothetical protein